MTVTQDLAAVERRLAQLGGPPFAAPPEESERFARALRGSSLDALFARAGSAAGVDPALLRAVAACESNFDPGATSRAGAAGLMQLMPQTATALGVTDRYDPVQNVRAGATYLRSLLDRFAGDLPLALAAYNAGPSAVARHRRVPPFPETERYVARVLATYRVLLGR